MPIYRPRMVAKLGIPVMGNREQRLTQEDTKHAIGIIVRPKRIRLESNDHNTADSLSLTCDWTEVACDPRSLSDASVAFYLDNADDHGHWVANDKNLRFLGNASTISCTRSSESSPEFTIECVDYTSHFLRTKDKFGSSGIPRYDQNLEEAWRTIVSQTPGAEALAGNIEFHGMKAIPELRKAVSERFSKYSRVPVEIGADAWAVWQKCVGMCGLISYIKLDRCIVTTATNLYSDEDPAVLTWGKNVSEWSEERAVSLVGKGVGLTSFDPISGTTIEAVYDDPTPKRKRANAKSRAGKGDDMRQSEEREYYAYPGVTDVAQLTLIAKRVWEERSRQELAGRVKTSEIYTQKLSGESAALLDIAAGDTVSVVCDPSQLPLLAQMPNDTARINYLTQRGHEVEEAERIVAHTNEFAHLSSKFFVKNVHTELEVDEDGGSFTIEIDYCNRIE